MNKKDKQWIQMSRFEIFLKNRKYIALVLTLVAMVCWGLNVPLVDAKEADKIHRQIGYCVILGDNANLLQTGQRIEGEKKNDGIYFRGLKGYCMKALFEQKQQGDRIDSAHTLWGDSPFNRGNTTITAKGKGENQVEFTMTFNIEEGCGDIINVSPIYERSDGSVYLIYSQEKFHLQGKLGNQIRYFSSQRVTNIDNGQVNKTDININLNIEAVSVATGIQIKEMNENDECINIVNYDIEASPVLKCKNETAYCLVEEYYKKNKSDEAMNVKRKIYNMAADAKSLSYDYYVYFDGVAVKAKQIVFEK